MTVISGYLPVSPPITAQGIGPLNWTSATSVTSASSASTASTPVVPAAEPAPNAAIAQAYAAAVQATLPPQATSPYASASASALATSVAGSSGPPTWNPNSPLTFLSWLNPSIPSQSLANAFAVQASATAAPANSTVSVTASSTTTSSGH